MAETASVQDDSVEIEINLEELAVPAAELLSDADCSTRDTRPYEVPLDDELFGDLTRTSAQFTVPVALDELPDDAYPTEIYFFGAVTDSQG